MNAVLGAALAVFILLGLTAAVCSARPGWRKHLSVAAPVVLGAACLAGAGALLHQFPGSWDNGEIIAWLALGHLGSPLATLLAAAAAVGLARVSFRTEHDLVGLLHRPAGTRTNALPVELLSLNLPGRAETMRDVARTARAPVRFWGLSLLTVLGEESFFRVAMPAALITAGFPAWLAVLLPAAAYALNHVGFGTASVAGKLLLGLVLGAGAWAGGAALVSVPAHMLYQRWVQRQFVHSPARSRHDHATPSPRPRPRT
ncbi:CPBP family glutamic-type intramembrane protease [Arthrobacter sp. H35-D1]|uniref:CPBP family glutamic-type intramembrane protease n=1 Tax=Arthrobacter sp. H35-D1 TaxID=3046202 RepID=UPI0024B88AEC|nr:CPBP family glutamic-type intramembrane protease [Arthrobacter sp. H35-D1]MDJ0312183.1 CPBP family glutamic-type intramembrane protease [Arthrobacter sp. H35-D1]